VRARCYLSLSLSLSLSRDNTHTHTHTRLFVLLDLGKTSADAQSSEQSSPPTEETAASAEKKSRATSENRDWNVCHILSLSPPLPSSGCRDWTVWAGYPSHSSTPTAHQHQAYRASRSLNSRYVTRAARPHKAAGVITFIVSLCAGSSRSSYRLGAAGVWFIFDYCCEDVEREREREREKSYAVRRCCYRDIEASMFFCVHLCCRRRWSARSRSRSSSMSSARVRATSPKP